MKRFTFLLFIFVSFLSAQPSKAQEESGWTRQKSGVLAKLSALFFLDARRGWAAGSNGALLATDDGGENWRRLPLPERESKEPINDIWFFNAAHGCVLGEYGPFNRLPNPSGSIERVFLMTSYDGGANWQPNELSAAAPPVRGGLAGRTQARPDAKLDPKPDEPKSQSDPVLVRMAFANQTIGWACGETGVIQATTNGGASWQLQPVMTKKLLYDVAAIDETRAVIVGSGGTILRTVDGGRNWREAGSGVTQILRAVHFANSKLGWAAGSGGVIVATANGGGVWQKQESGTTQNLNDLVFVTEKEGWAAGDRGLLLHTTDGGATWEAVELGTHANLSRMFFTAPDCGWVVGASGTIFKYGGK
ncbi:MAG: WD40/YVTN/BNR-like repeat-containing protein [Blastocatellia bacterium]